MREMALFAVIRLALWVGIWWVLTLFDIGVMLAGVLAALLAMLISILFLHRIREAAAMRWKAADDRRRARKGEPVDEDAVEEDALLDDYGRATDADGKDIDGDRADEHAADGDDADGDGADADGADGDRADGITRPER
ncbi:DUF4229 domain-containing protein [Brachybacterium sp. GCM10030268]|uniref:DUF4229 domain-containing protein n=1 Tax=Brachybacterium sp. GCM10030268 TaxID=3273382 RepID=UPI00360C1E4A